METHVNTYGGMNKDTSFDSITPNFYIDALDVRITASDDASMGAVTNLKGNIFSFTVPQHGGGINEIIGVTNIRNTIILFVATDDMSNSWIYKMEYSEDGQTLTTVPTLVYSNPNLSFSKLHPIEAVGRFESFKTQRIYWSDYKEYFRSLNIADPNVLTTPIELIDFQPGITYTQPIVRQVSGGGSLMAGVYQFAYRLTTFDGKKTFISPPGNLVHVTSSSEGLGQSAQYIGAIKGTNTGKSLGIEIDITNYQSFEKIELIALFHEDLHGTPAIKSIETKTITSASSLTFVYTGTEDTITSITTTEFALKSYPFSTCKTMTQVDNSLLIANLKSKTFSIKDRATELGESFDAKTYRYKKVGATITPSTDVFNQEYNKDAQWDALWHYNSQYKFKSDGVRLGGQGVNISYTFEVQPMLVNGSPTAGFANIANVASTGHNLGDGYSYTNTTFDSQASPYISGLIRGYKRGETYRFGIIFYNKKGEASFVEHIGDIKFPDISDYDSVANAAGSHYFITTLSSSNITTAYNLGIRFNIDFSTCPLLLSEIDSYQIVRLDRDNNNKRRAATGTIRTFSKSPIDTNGGSGYDMKINGSDQVLHLHKDTKGYYGYLQSQSATSSLPDLFGNYVNFSSPEISYNFDGIGEHIVDSSNTMLLFTNALKTNTLQTTTSVDTSGGEKLGQSLDDIRMTWYDCLPVDKTSTTATYPTIGSYRGLEYVKQFDNKHLFRMGYSSDLSNSYTSLIGGYYVRNFYAGVNPSDSSRHLNKPNGASGNDTTSHLAKGPTGIISKLNKVLTDPLTGNALGLSSTYDYFDTSNVSIIGASDGLVVMDILTPKQEIYGGFTQNALENNIFVPASPVIKVANLSPLVFGGDIFLNAYTFQSSCTFNDPYYYDNASSSDRKYYHNISKTEVVVLESCVNIDLDCGATIKRGVTFSAGATALSHERYRQETGNDSSTYGIAPYDMYKYNGAYTEQGTDLTFFIQPSKISSVATNDIRAYLSNVKINDETLDSWTQFLTNNYWDVDDHGPINKVLRWRTNTFFFQDKAVGNYIINPISLVTSSSGITTNLGTGEGIVRHQYLTTENGAIHQYGIKMTDSAVYYFDALTKKIFALRDGNEPLSEVKGIHSFTSKFVGDVLLRKENNGDNPILGKGLNIGKDTLNDDILFSFHGINSNGDSVTLVYDEAIGQFSSFYSAKPKIYIENRNILLSPNPQYPHNVYLHNHGDYGRFYGNIEECYVKLVINPNADLNKVLRFLEFNSIVKDSTGNIDRTKTVSAFKIDTQHQTTGKVLFSPSRFKHKFNKWRLKIPRDQNSVSKQGRLRNTYFVVTLYFDNNYPNDNKELILNRLLSYYDVQIF